MSSAGSSESGAFSPYREGTLVAEKYRLIERIGEGGMGAVWAARNEVLDSNVAIKLLRTDRELETISAARLLKEARAASKLEHPAIVRIFDFGHTVHGDPFIVMERLAGESLAERLDRRARLDALLAVQILLPILGALALAHDTGIVHRDVKPENIFLAEADGRRIQPKLLDFGVAKLGGPGGEAFETLEGALVGSAPYMSPEQARGLPDIDHRADVWAVAVVLYELVTGVRPFEGGNYNAIMMSIVSDDPRPITTLAAGDVELWSLIGRGLEKRREARWQSAREFGMALAQWLLDRDCTSDVSGASLHATWFATGPTSSVPPAGPGSLAPLPELGPRSDRMSLTVAGSRRSLAPAATADRRARLWIALLVVAAAIAGLLLWRSTVEPPAERARAASPAAPPPKPIKAPAPSPLPEPAPPEKQRAATAAARASAPSPPVPRPMPAPAASSVVRRRLAPAPMRPPAVTPLPKPAAGGGLKDPY